MKSVVGETTPSYILGSHTPDRIKLVRVASVALFSVLLLASSKVKQRVCPGGRNTVTLLPALGGCVPYLYLPADSPQV